MIVPIGLPGTARSWAGTVGKLPRPRATDKKVGDMKITIPIWIKDVLADGPRYCKYCYGDHDLEIGSDGSLIVCSSCGAGLARLDAVIADGSYDAYQQRITEEFYEACANPVNLDSRVNVDRSTS